jgi:hypothetical protein
MTTDEVNDLHRKLIDDMNKTKTIRFFCYNYYSDLHSLYELTIPLASAVLVSLCYFSFSQTNIQTTLNLFNSIFSLYILVISLILSNLALHSRSQLFLKAGQEIDKILKGLQHKEIEKSFSAISYKDASTKYHEILCNFENHKDCHFYLTVVKQKELFQKKYSKMSRYDKIYYQYIRSWSVRIPAYLINFSLIAAVFFSAYLHFCSMGFF